jgi:hypothetical protein
VNGKKGKNWDLIVGRVYRVTYLPGGARTRTRMIQAKLIGVMEDRIIFSGREQKPDFGTAHLNPKQIVKVEEVK